MLHILALPFVSVTTRKAVPLQQHLSSLADLEVWVSQPANTGTGGSVRKPLSVSDRDIGSDNNTINSILQTCVLEKKNSCHHSAYVIVYIAAMALSTRLYTTSQIAYRLLILIFHSPISFQSSSSDSQGFLRLTSA